MAELENNPRYLVGKFFAKSLEKNPLGSPAERHIHIYLPPDYFKDLKRSYPVIYFLHGYLGSHQNITVGPNAEDKWKPLTSLGPEIAAMFHTERMASYHMFDQWLQAGEVKPFIFVQPDGSLHRPHMLNVKNMVSGEISLKGSFYIDSPYIGNYESYIANDIIKYVDHSYRTIPEAAHRALVGSSMGGYGALSVCLGRPGLFAAVAALSPGNFTQDTLSWKLRVPMLHNLLGEEAAAETGDIAYNDILDTMDLVYSNDRRLLPTIKFSPDGKVVECDRVALANWEKRDLNNIIKSATSPFKDIKLKIDCDRNDEFGLAAEAAKIHTSLRERGVPHEFEIYYDPEAAPSPHQLGIAYRTPAAIKFCLSHIG